MAEQTRDTGDPFVEVRVGRERGWKSVAVLAGGLGLTVALVLLAPTAVQRAGASAWVGYLLCGVLGVLIALSVGELASRKSVSEVGLHGIVCCEGDLGVSFAVGWLLILGSSAVAGLATQAFASYAAPLLAAWFPSAWLPGAALAGVAVIVGTWGNIVGTHRTRLWQSLLIAALATLIGVAALWSLFHGRPASVYQPPLPFGELLNLAALLASTLIGIELALQARGSMRSPNADLSRSLLLAIGFTYAIPGLLLLAVAGSRVSPLWTEGAAPWTLLVGDALGPVGSDLAPILVSLALWMAILTTLSLSARQIRELARGGYLPKVRGLSSSSVAGRYPPAILVGGIAFALSFAPATWLAPACAVSFLLIGLIVCARNITTPAADLAQVLPARPLIPGLAIAGCVILLARTSPAGWPICALWIGAGALLYVLYGRRGHIEAQKGEQVFTVKEEASPKDAKRYCVLVPVIGGGVRRLQIQLALSIARRNDGEVLPLSVVSLSEQMTRDEARRIARESSQLLRWSLPDAEAEGIPIRPIARLSQNIARGILDTAREEGCNLILLGWRGQSKESGTGLSRVVDEVVRNAPCDVAVVKGREMEAVKRILVPTAGGPHAPLAADLALELATDNGGQVTLLYVTGPNPTEEECALARERIAKTLEGLERRELAETKILPSEVGITESILAESRGGYDLVLLGASETSLLDQIIFGSVPERIARAAEVPVVMARHYAGAARYWSFRIWNAVESVFPDLSAEEQIELYQDLREDARPGVNYFILIVLSCIIATLGLLQNSAAVIIGAMLVAPLMSPIMGISMAVVRADFRLLTLALETAVKGAAASVAISSLLTLLAPNLTLGSEILARTHPTILDLVVALASGAAGAYAMGRKEVAAALPGVAVAAALMPPLSVIGIGIATGQGAIAGGALLLFVTNLIAISVAGAIVFLLLGMRPRRERDSRLKQGLAISFLLLVVISIPLGVIMARSLTMARQEQIVRQAIASTAETWDGYDFSIEMLRLSRTQDETRIEAQLLMSRPLTAAQAAQAQSAIERALKHPVRLRMDVIQASMFELPASAP